MNTSPPESRNIATTISKLEATGEYRVLRALQPLARRPDAFRPVICGIVDCEATSKDPATAAPVELGMVKVGFDPTDPSSIVVISSLAMLNDPGVPSDPGAEAVHGINQADLKGKRFDLTQIDSFLTDVDFLVAHNAGYDRPVLSRAIPALASKPWTCSMREVDWGSLGISSRSLDYLLYKAGLFHEGHRAEADCDALLAVVSHPFLGGLPPLFALNESRQESAWIFLCQGAPFEAKDLMKQRGYRWNTGDTPGDIPVKCWSTPEIAGKQALLDELNWLCAYVYGMDRSLDAVLTAIPMDASTRYSENARKTAFEKRKSTSLVRAIAKLQQELAPTASAQAPVAYHPA